VVVQRKTLPAKPVIANDGLVELGINRHFGVAGELVDLGIAELQGNGLGHEGQVKLGALDAAVVVNPGGTTGRPVDRVEGVGVTIEGDLIGLSSAAGSHHGGRGNQGFQEVFAHVVPFGCSIISGVLPAKHKHLACQI
jgi:hypothetical protein